MRFFSTFHFELMPVKENDLKSRDPEDKWQPDGNVREYVVNLIRIRLSVKSGI